MPWVEMVRAFCQWRLQVITEHLDGWMLAVALLERLMERSDSLQSGMAVSMVNVSSVNHIVL